MYSAALRRIVNLLDCWWILRQPEPARMSLSSSICRDIWLDRRCSRLLRSSRRRSDMSFFDGSFSPLPTVLVPPPSLSDAATELDREAGVLADVGREVSSSSGSASKPVSPKRSVGCARRYLLLSSMFRPEGNTGREDEALPEEAAVRAAEMEWGQRPGVIGGGMPPRPAHAPRSPACCCIKDGLVCGAILRCSEFATPSPEVNAP
mmetsp:Transcript_12536/g.36341  ORF Transcript_12536/g.36341 Transcript_12536/m.36341 type:complete len:206 (+) Transcript_12536:679-1296(+)